MAPCAFDSLPVGREPVPKQQEDVWVLLDHTPDALPINDELSPVGVVQDGDRALAFHEEDLARVYEFMPSVSGYADWRNLKVRLDRAVALLAQH